MIRLPVGGHQSAEDQRRAYVESNEALTRKLGDAIREICAKHREEYEQYLFVLELGRLMHVLDGRQPNETLEEQFEREWGKMKGSDYAVLRERVAWVSRLTDYPQPPAKNAGWEKHYEYGAWEKNKERPAFVVSKRANADDLIRKGVKEYVDGVIARFVYKVQDKLTDIVVHHKEYAVSLDHGAFRNGCFEGDLQVQFVDGVSFRVHVALKHNTSSLGNPYVQYPLTFHDVVRGAGSSPISLCSEGEILDTMGIIPWKPVKTKKPWVTLGVGDIVETTKGHIRMVVGTRSPRITLDDGEKVSTPFFF